MGRGAHLQNMTWSRPRRREGATGRDEFEDTELQQVYGTPRDSPKGLRADAEPTRKSARKVTVGQSVTWSDTAGAEKVYTRRCEESVIRWGAADGLGKSGGGRLLRSGRIGREEPSGASCRWEASCPSPSGRHRLTSTEVGETVSRFLSMERCTSTSDVRRYSRRA